MKKKLINQKGVTLIEIILGIALFGIISISLIPVITMGFIQINHSGDKSEALYSTQQSIEKNLDGEVDGVATTTAKTIKIIFGATEVSVAGKTIQAEIQYDAAGNKTLIKSFKPN